jgi:DNA-binding response OmpR family regulator
MRIAILDDDVSQLELLSHWLQAAGHDPQPFERGEQLLSSSAQQAFDVLILDWNVPGLDGIEVLRRVRQTSKVPVLFCTSCDAQDHVVKALQTGADDYIIKPARKLELLARINAVVRRQLKRDAIAESFQMGEFHVDFEKRAIVRDTTVLGLTAKDFDMAVLFLRNVNRLLSRTHIAEAVWGNAGLQSRTVDTHVSRVRTRLGLVPEQGWRLSSVYRHGYRLERAQARTAVGRTGTELSTAQTTSRR